MDSRVRRTQRPAAVVIRPPLRALADRRASGLQLHEPDHLYIRPHVADSRDPDGLLHPSPPRLPGRPHGRAALRIALPLRPEERTRRNEVMN